MFESSLFESSASTKGASKKLYKHLKQNFHTAAKSEKDWEQFKGKPFSSEMMMNRKFKDITSYGYDLFKRLETGLHGIAGPDSGKFPQGLIKEAWHWESEGAMCIHISVILYSLLIEEKVFTPNSLQYVQGYYYHETRTDSPIALMLGKEHIGLHAWLLTRGSVIDITIGQENRVFDFGDFDFVLGEVHEGLLLKGINEPKKIVDNYVKDFAKNLGISKEEWIQRQVSYFNTYTNK